MLKKLWKWFACCGSWAYYMWDISEHLPVINVVHQHTQYEINPGFCRRDTAFSIYSVTHPHIYTHNYFFLPSLTIAHLIVITKFMVTILKQKAKDNCTDLHCFMNWFIMECYHECQPEMKYCTINQCTTPVELYVVTPVC